jgi:hypothetical protein
MKPVATTFIQLIKKQKNTEHSCLTLEIFRITLILEQFKPETALSSVSGRAGCIKRASISLIEGVLGSTKCLGLVCP